MSIKLSRKAPITINERARLSLQCPVRAPSGRMITARLRASNCRIPIRKNGLVRAHWMKGEDQLTERDLGFVRRGFRWALTTPLTRDVVSSSETFFRWCAHRPDPHLGGGIGFAHSESQ